MDILQEWFESGEELQSTGLFCHDVSEHLPALDHSDGSATIDSRTLPLLSHATTPTAPPTEGTVTNSLLRSHSVDKIHHLSVNQSTVPSSTARELPCIPRCESYRCQSVFPALSCSNADTTHVEIALEMPRYLLQEDESALVDESGVSEEVTAANKVSSTPHKPPSVSSCSAPSSIKPHRTTTGSQSPFKTTLPHKAASSAQTHKAPANSAVFSKVTPPHVLTAGVPTVEPIQTTKSDHLNHAYQLQYAQNSGSPSSWKSVSFVDNIRGGGGGGMVDDATRANYTWSCDSQLAPAGPPLAVCFPQPTRSSNANTLMDGVRLVNLRATPISIASVPRHQSGTHGKNSSCERKKRRHGGGWPKGKSRKLDNQVSLPKPPATGYNIFLSENRDRVKADHGTSSMSALSKVMGQMWSRLSAEEKASYYSQAEQDRHRYISEMKTYFSQLYKGMSAVDLSEVESVLTASTILENDDEALHCQVCQISFTSLNNKLSHFTGRTHRQAIIEQLHSKLALRNKATRVVSTANSTGNTDGQDKEEREGSDMDGPDLVNQLTRAAMLHKASSEQLTKAKQHYCHLIETNTDLQQQIGELEYMEVCEASVLDAITTEGHSTLAALQRLSQTLASLGVDHKVDAEISIAGSFQLQPVQAVGGGIGHAFPP